jgi:hypothetical protein
LTSVTGPGGSWGRAEEVPATGNLNKGGSAAIYSVSCASAGNCSAGGDYTDTAGGHYQAFVDSQVNGKWSDAMKVPGALNKGDGQIFSVSCASAGSCSAGGVYTDTTGDVQAFVDSQSNGKWSDAIQVPGTGALNQGGFAQGYTVSCGSAGSCTAGGQYTDYSSSQAYLANQANGKWSDAIKVADTINKGHSAKINSVSCASAGNCTAGGYYSPTSGISVAFAVSQVNGAWQKVEEIPGLGKLNTDGNAQISTVSCASAGNCTAGGSYSPSSGVTEAFVASQVNGKWKDANKVADTLNTDGIARITSVSCVSAGNCTAGGSYANAAGLQAFVVSQANGTWEKAEQVPGTSKLTSGNIARVNAVSCASAGNCSAGGSYSPSSSGTQAFVANQVNGKWKDAIEVANSINTSGNAQISSLSCAPAGTCSADGYYTNASGRQAFVVNQT